MRSVIIYLKHAPRLRFLVWRLRYIICLEHAPHVAILVHHVSCGGPESRAPGGPDPESMYQHKPFKPVAFQQAERGSRYQYKEAAGVSKLRDLYDPNYRDSENREP